MNCDEMRLFEKFKHQEVRPFGQLRDLYCTKWQDMGRWTMMDARQKVDRLSWELVSARLVPWTRALVKACGDRREESRNHIVSDRVNPFSADLCIKNARFLRGWFF